MAGPMLRPVSGRRPESQARRIFSVDGDADYGLAPQDRMTPPPSPAAAPLRNHLILPAAPRPHVVCREQTPAGWPARAAIVPPAFAPDSTAGDYHPSHFDRPRPPSAYHASPISSTQPDPADHSRIDFGLRRSLFAPLHFDAAGRPLNPIGPTGICGRGDLWRWGPNHSVTVVVTRTAPDGTTEFASILRRDVREWSVIGGFRDPDDRSFDRAAARECAEETGLVLPPHDGRRICAAYLDNNRNTDNAWIENWAYHWHLPYADTLRSPLCAGDDAVDVRWAPATPEHAAELFASSGYILLHAVQQLTPAQQAPAHADGLYPAGQLIAAASHHHSVGL